MGYIKPGSLGSRQKVLRGGIWFALLPLLISGCGYIIKKEVYVKDQKLVQTKVEFIRRQMLAHTQILQRHGRSINEVRLRLRDMASRTRGAGGPRRAARPGGGMKASARPAPSRAASRAKGSMKGGHPVGKSLFVRATYRGLPLNYAGGYRKPRGKRYPYRLSPGTLVEVLSADRRGFTRIRVKSGRWKGRRMWVRTRWLVEKMKSRRRRTGRG